MKNETKSQWSLVIILAGLVLGTLADLFFYRYPPGINILLYWLIFLVVAAILIEASKQRWGLSNALFVIPLLFFAGMLGVICWEQFLMINLLLMGGFGLIVVYFLTEPRFLGGNIVQAIRDLITGAITLWFEPLWMVGDVARLSQTVEFKSEKSQRTSAVLRGCLLALPIVLVFAALLSSADMVFSDLISGLVSWIDVDSVFEPFAHLVFILIFAWGTAAALKVMIQKPDYKPSRIPSFEAVSNSSQSSVLPKPLRLGMIESGIVLGSVDALFLVFVIIQGAYLFGGKSNITRQGYTFAEYARRGFFELLAVSVFTLLLVLALDFVTERKPHHERWFRGASMGLIVMALVILASAFQRLRLYEDAYGFTRLRVISHVFMVWLAVLFAVLALNLYRIRPNLFWYGSAAVALGFCVTLNVMNVDAFIAGRNVDRYRDTGKIDVGYLITLSDDAVPALVDLLDELDVDSAEWHALRIELNGRYAILNSDHEQRSRSFLAFHYGKWRAWKALDDLGAVLWVE
ncbi:MAG TPA: DUF4173 domain-containing protein [Aggregatilineaceae bacterium]|nr:DUF4173 domain-containing protein [Aggregatilineaceae bacterium]